MRKRILLGVVMVFVVLMLGGFVSAQGNESNYTVEVEQDVLDALNSSGWAPVIVELYFGNETILDQILSNLTEDEFKLKRKLLGDDAFAGNLSQAGLDKLINNPDIREIYLNRIAHVLNNETNSINNETANEEPDNQTEEEQEEITSEIKTEKKSLLGLWIIIGIIVVISIIIINLMRKKK
ncbi:MAG: hypothetical protein IIA87_03760 [Nanoarchaeota archaeon]|nr:hypothetical protein [Nanoarchaeota archaeon]